MSPLIQLTLAAALVMPTLAVAGPIVPFRVPGRVIDDVADWEQKIAPEQLRIEDHEMAVDHRQMAKDIAQEHLDLANEFRRSKKKRLKRAEKAYKKAENSRMGVERAANALAMAKREFYEADDFVAVAHARVAAMEEHVEVERARVDLAVAKRELREAELVQMEAGPMKRKLHRPGRFEEQVRDVRREMDEELTEWKLARVRLAERLQDHTNANPRMSMNDPYDVEILMLGGGDFADDDMSRFEGMSGTEYDLQRVHFDLGEATLDTDALNNLAWNAYVLRNNRDAAVRVEGHTDATGPMALNRELAWDRAEAVESYLRRHGVWDVQLETAAYGETWPLARTSSANELNRRVEFRVFDANDATVDGTIDDPIDPWNDIDE